MKKYKSHKSDERYRIENQCVAHEWDVFANLEEFHDSSPYFFLDTALAVSVV